jgi:hypothetical protein
MKPWLFLALAGCYLDFRPGVTTPVGQGHGSAAVDLDVATGAAYESRRLDVGGGIMIGAHAADADSYVPFGIEGRVAMDLSNGRTDRDLLFVAHAGVAAAVGMPRQNPMDGKDPNGVATSMFAGFALGDTKAQRDFSLRQVAFGVSASQFWPSGAGAFWSIGGAIELSYAFGLQ